MTSDDVYVIMKYAVAKNLQQGYLSPEDFYRVINMGQRQYLDYLMGQYQKYQIQRPIAVVEFGQNEEIRNSIAPLIYGTFLSPNATTGIASFPGDYEGVDAMWGIYNFYRIKFIEQNRLFSHYHSTIDPLVTNPVYLIRHEGFQFYPENIGMTRLSYVRTPPSITWAWVADSNGIPVYDPLNSQQPVWGERDMANIICRALVLVGVNLNFSTVIQYAQDIKNGGG